MRRTCYARAPTLARGARLGGAGLVFYLYGQIHGDSDRGSSKLLATSYGRAFGFGLGFGMALVLYCDGGLGLDRASGCGIGRGGEVPPLVREVPALPFPGCNMSVGAAVKAV